MEEDLKYFCKWKLTSNTFVNGRQPLIFCKWKKNLKYIFVHGRRPQTTLIENDSVIKYINVLLCELNPSGWLA